MNGLPASPIAGSSNTSSWSAMIGEMSGGQHRVDEVTRTESRRLDSKNKPRIAAHRPPKETADCAMQESVRKEQKKSQTLLTWPTSLEMLRTGIITTYPTVRRIPGLRVGV